MKHMIIPSILVGSISCSTLAFAEAGGAANSGNWVQPGAWFVYGVVILILLASFVAIVVIRTALADSTWSLRDALSEEVEISATETTNGITKPVIDTTTQKPIMITEMRASSSRVIAFIGMIIIVLMFLGFGAFALFGFAMTGTMPESIDNVVKFLVAGLTLFAPYLVNKFSSIFDALSTKK